MFAGTMNPAFHQIGNAVPPLLVAKIAEQIPIQLRGCSDEKARHEEADSI